MTTGQRIAAKRKENSLSQEALGERLGVSRQSIYKWESDTSLPEIDKLVAMSRLFSVSVGWLLGVEEPSAPEGAEPVQAPEALTPGQQEMVEEILSRYQQAQTTPPPKPRKRWLYVLAALGAIWCGWYFVGRLEQMEQQYTDLAGSINNVTYSVSSQISSITSRVEEILKAQNDLTADYSVQLTSVDLKENTATFSLRSVPKTYTQGMEVLFLADAGEGPVEVPGQEGAGRAFTAEVTCALTDSITLSAAFLRGDVRQTQLLNTYDGLYSASLPPLELRGLESGLLNLSIGEDDLFHIEEQYAYIEPASAEKELPTDDGPAALQSVRIGLFRNFQPIAWMEPCQQPENWRGDYPEGTLFFRHPPLERTVETGDILVYVAIFTDQYGRTSVAPSVPVFVREGDALTWQGGDVSEYFDLSNYTY